MSAISSLATIAVLFITCVGIEFLTHPATASTSQAGQTVRSPKAGEGLTAAHPTYIGFNPFNGDAA